MTKDDFLKEQKNILSRIKYFESLGENKYYKKTQELRKRLVKLRLENPKFWEDYNYFY
tara:strand:- start:485 stop:658 length:174 start_codon:yes stop_codon:yes gene_type:complete